jgi:hypothetical protein
LHQFTGRAMKQTVVIIVASLLSTSTKIVSRIFLSQLSRYIDKIIGDNQCGFRRNTDKIFCIHYILQKKMGVQEDDTSAIQIHQESL